MKIRIQSSGTHTPARVNTTDTHREIRMAMPMIRSMAPVFPFPQYCAVSTAAPEVMPKKIRVMINCTCPARDAPDRAVSLTLPSIITSAAFTATLMRFCSAIGTTSAITIRRNCRFSALLPKSSVCSIFSSFSVFQIIIRLLYHILLPLVNCVSAKKTGFRGVLFRRFHKKADVSRFFCQNVT